MDLSELGLSLQKNMQSLSECWLFKLILSTYLAMAGSIHGNALGAFIMLIFLDLATRWVAIAKSHLLDTGKIAESQNIYNCLANIPIAFRAGYINSMAMKQRFASKIILYGALTIMAANADILLNTAGETPILLRMTWIYLATTETMSILENLREAGVEEAGSLLDFIKEKWQSWLEKNKRS